MQCALLQALSALYRVTALLRSVLVRVVMILFLLLLGVIGFFAHRSIRYIVESGAVEDRARAFLQQPTAMVALLWAIIGPELILPPLPVALVPSSQPSAWQPLLCTVPSSGAAAIAAATCSAEQS